MSGVYSLADLLRQVIQVGEELLYCLVYMLELGFQAIRVRRVGRYTDYWRRTNSWRAKQAVRDNPPTEDLTDRLRTLN